MRILALFLLSSSLLTVVSAWIPSSSSSLSSSPQQQPLLRQRNGRQHQQQQQQQQYLQTKETTTTTTLFSVPPIGIFFGTSTGNTETCAEKLHAALSNCAAEPVDIDSLEPSQVVEAFGKHSALIVGTPTWNTGADTERSGTGWDALYYDTLPSISDVLNSKTVAVFGLGDQVSYAENYADATGELYDVFQGLGCNMVGFTSTEGYEHESSKSIRVIDGTEKFCGLLLDQINQEELTDERIEQWVAQLKQEGILEGGAVSAAPGVTTTTAAPAAVTVVTTSSSSDLETRLKQLEEENAALKAALESSASSRGATAGSGALNGFTPHTNPVTKKTLWTSPDGRTAYVTSE